MMIKKLNLKSICLSIGVCLILVSMVVLIFWQYEIERNAKSVSEYVQTLKELIPETHSAVIEPRVNNDMPLLNIRENNFVALLELPANNSSFPVGASWGNMEAYPCLYSGSAYDSSMNIGTSNQRGQFEFVKEISVGDNIYLTDMTGNRFSYEVADIRYSDHADNQTLNAITDDLTIFVKNVYAFEYIIIYCDTLS